jgi:uncharacterized protein (DUF1800 family)
MTKSFLAAGDFIKCGRRLGKYGGSGKVYMSYVSHVHRLDCQQVNLIYVIKFGKTNPDSCGYPHLTQFPPPLMRAIPHSLTSILCLSASVLGLSTAAATTDFYSSGPGQGASDLSIYGKELCDVWQALYGGWGLNPDGDEDFDGATNYIESVAGTDPRNANDVIRVGNTTILGNSISFTFDAEKGKRYRILSDSTSPTGAYATVKTISAPLTNLYEGNQAFIPSASNPAQTITVTRSGTREYYRLETTDADRDGDGVSDWAEGQLGSDAGVSDSGAGYTYADTLHSMLSLTATATAPNGYERNDKSLGGAAVAVPAKIRLTRTWPPVGSPVPVMALNGITMTTSGGAPSATKANASANDHLALTAVSIPANAGAAGGSPFEVNVTPVQDLVEEVPEYLKVTFNLPGGSGAAAPSATVCLCDSDPTNTNNSQLYVAYLGHEAGMTTTATGYATALVNGDNTQASISLVFSNLSSTQNTAYIRNVSGGVVTDNDLAPALPTGQVSGFQYEIQNKGSFFTTDQAFLTGLGNGSVGCAVTSANFPNKEIWGIFNKTTGSTTFTPPAEAPALGSTGWQNPTGEALEREIWRFMGQSTWGGTQALYNEILAEVNAATGGGGTYLTGLSNWLDKQMNPTLTPSLNFRTLVMAADNEDLALRGNKPVTYNNDAQVNGVRYTVTYDAAGNPIFGTTADGNFINNNYPISGPNRRREWWGMILQSKDQVRQRFTQALSEIVIISEADQTCADRHYGTAHYWDMMAENAFGRYRNLLEKVTYSPMMGVYLSHISNRSAYDAGGGVIVSPDENYAREIMQLFSIGLVLRHPDGSLVLDSAGLPIPTYDNDDITELARVMTGFSHGAQHAIGYYNAWDGNTLRFSNGSSSRTSDLVLLNGSSATNTWFGRATSNDHLFWAAPWIYPMKVIGRITGTPSVTYHDFGAKVLLNGKHKQTTVPAQTITSMTDVQTHAAADADLKIAHDMLAGDPALATYNGHQNTPVNMSRWLIQRLVTSNPSAGYIHRVQQAYLNSNGNLGTVMKAILLDYEARSLELADSSISHGKVKEPIVAFANMLRTLRAFSGLPISTLKDSPPSFSGSDSPLPNGLPQGEYDKFSTENINPPSLPTGWPQGPWRFRFNDLTGAIGQSPQRAPSVFNWFLPDYVVPGPMAEAGLYAPELQINTEASVVAKVNQFYNVTWSNLVGMNAQPGTDANISDMLLNNASATPAVRFSLDGGATFVNSVTIPTGSTAPVNVTVVGANTNWLANTDNSTLRFNVTGTGSGYDGLGVQPVNIDVVDNDLVNEQIVALHSNFTTWVAEGGKTDTIQVRLSATPSANVTVNLSAGVEVTLGSSSLTFTPANWNTTQSVTVSAVNDTDLEAPGTGNDSITLTSVSTLGAWNGLTATIPVGVTDNDNAYDILVTEVDTFGPAGTNVTETTQTTYVSGNAGIVDAIEIVLTRQPSASVAVTLTPSSNGNQIAMNDTATGTNFVTTAVSRTFTTTNWNTAQRVLIRGNDDGGQEMAWPANPMHAGLITLSTAAVGGYAATNAYQTVGVAVADNDNRLIMEHTNGETRVSEDGTVTDTINVRLRTSPAAGTVVVVNLGSNQLKCTPTNLTFTPANFSQNQEVTVEGVDDTLSEGLQRAWAAPMEVPLLAAGTTNVASGSVTGVNITIGGSNYVGNVPSVTFSGGGGSGASGTAIVNAAGRVVGVNMINGGSGYTSAPTVTFGTPFQCHAQITASATGSTAETNYNNLWGNTYTGIFTQLFATVIDNDQEGIIVTQTGGETTVVEGGVADSVGISLSHQPSADVTITLTPGGQLTASPSTLTFTSSNWASAQNITVAAINDTTVEGDANSLTSLGIVATSSDRSFGGVKVRPVPVTVVDNDRIAVSIAHTNGWTTVAEGSSGTTAEGVVRLSDGIDFTLPRTPTANVTVTLLPDSNITVSPSTLTFTASNSGTAQRVTITAVDDAVNEAAMHLAALRFATISTDPYYNNAAHLPLMIPVRDNDAPSVAIAENTGITTPGEGGNDTYTLVLTKAPTANVVVNVTSSNLAEATVSPASITFTTANWNTPVTVTVTPVTDMLTEGRETISINHSINTTLTLDDVQYDSVTIPSVACHISDQHRRNESIVLIHSGGSIRSGDALPVSGNSFVTEGDGSTDSVEVYLTTRPQIPVTLTASPSTHFSMDKTILVFDSTNWNVPQTVTIQAIDDAFNDTYSIINGALLQNAQANNIVFTATAGDPAYLFVTNNTGGGAASINVLDNESPAVAISQTGGITTTTEGGATDTYSVRLTTQPNGDVVVNCTAATGSAVLPTSLTFNASTWNTPQTVTVTAAQDTTVEGNHQANITHTINQTLTTDTTGYSRSVTGASWSANSTTVTFSGASNNAGLAAGMNVFGLNIPAGTTISSIAGLTTGNPGTTIVLSNAPTVAGSAATLQFTIAGIQTVVNNINDDDNRIIITPSGLDTRVQEDGSFNDTYSVVLRSAPTANVTVTPTLPANQGLTISPTNVVFAPGTWNVPQTFTISGTNNGINHERARTVTITHASASSQSTFNAQTIHSIGVNALASDGPRLLLIDNPATTENGTLSTYRIALNRAPTANVTVTANANAQQEIAPPVPAGGSLVYGSSVAVTFTPTDWMNFQTLTTRAVDDAVVEQTFFAENRYYDFGQISHALSFSATSGYEPPSIALNGSTTVINTTNVNTSSTTGLLVGMEVSGAGIAPDTYVASITSATAFTISKPAVSSETGVSLTAAIAPPNHGVQIIDNETPGVRIIPTGGSTIVSESGTTDSYNVVLTAAPAADVVITATPDAQLTVASSPLTFTSANWSIPQSITVGAAADTTPENTHTGVVSHTLASTDPQYNGVQVPTHSASIWDNDGPQVLINQTGGTTQVTEGGANDSFTIALSQAPTANVTITFVPPMYIIPVPPYAKRWGYYTTDLSGSNQNRERVVIDYTELILLYRSTFYGSLTAAYSSSGGAIPAQPAENLIQNAHWAATKAIVDKTDLWWCGGSLKAKNPVLIEPNLPQPSPLPAPNPRQVLMECIYQLNGGGNSPGTTRYLPEIVFDPKNPPVGTFHDEIRDRCRWIGYLNSTVMPGFVQH